MFKKIFFLTGLITASIFYSSCSSDEPKEKTVEPAPTPAPEIELSRADKDILSNINDLAFDILNYTNNHRVSDNENIAVAPYSLATVFSMASNYAQGDDFNRLKSILKFENIDDLNALNLKLLSSLPLVDLNTKLIIANSAWINPSYKWFVPENLETLLIEMYKASIHKVDLSTSSGLHEINDWCSKATEGKIPVFLDHYESSRLATLNANYFHGEWTNKFDASKTTSRRFKKGDGFYKYVPTMIATLEAKWHALPEFRMVTLPYGNKSFNMHLILPEEGKTVSEILSNLNNDKWLELLNHQSYGSVDIALPKFKFSHDSDFFNYFNNIEIDNPTGDSGQLPISLIIQTVIIETDEAGTKAVVVSGVNSDPTADINPQFIFDHPFIFIIDEAQTGTILFSGIVQCP